ncbi:MAG: sugar ABC transporter substrate-binding protein [Methylorubrum populi]
MPEGSDSLHASVRGLTLAAALLACAGIGSSGPALGEPTQITVATVNNGDMIIMQSLTSQFEKAHPDIKLRWVVLEENVLRQRVTVDIATRAGQFDVVTVGNYEVPIWAKQGWLTPFDNLPAEYDVDDLIGTVREGLSVNGKLYGLPFYAESAMTYYRKDLFEKAGITMPEQPSYQQVRQFADALTDRKNRVFGICLRGKPGWGENMAYLTTLVHTFGGQWFGQDWKPALDAPAWANAIAYYVDILKKDGPPGATSNGFNENLVLFAGGRCGMWIDSTVAAGLLYDSSQSTVADKTAFAAMPQGEYKAGPTWLWSWNLAIPATSKKQEAARTFVQWATDKNYVKLVAKEKGWVSAPPGTRRSTYASEEYRKAAPFSGFVLKAIEGSNPNGQTQTPRPEDASGAQFVSIPEFQGLGTNVGQTLAATLTGRSTIADALSTAQGAATRTMQQAGYPKK